jgi:hypothetical protein
VSEGKPESIKMSGRNIKELLKIEKEKVGVGWGEKYFRSAYELIFLLS